MAAELTNEQIDGICRKYHVGDAAIQAKAKGANLRALCQRHHSAHDHHHIAKAQATRWTGRAMGDLFTEAQP